MQMHVGQSPVSINCIFLHNCSLPFKSSLLAPAVASSPGGLGSFCRHQTDCRTVPPSAAVWRWRQCRPPSQRRVNGPFSLNFGTEHLGHLPQPAQPSPAQPSSHVCLGRTASVEVCVWVGILNGSISLTPVKFLRKCVDILIHLHITEKYLLLNVKRNQISSRDAFLSPAMAQ